MILHVNKASFVQRSPMHSEHDTTYLTYPEEVRENHKHLEIQYSKGWALEQSSQKQYYI